MRSNFHLITVFSFLLYLSSYSQEQFETIASDFLEANKHFQNSDQEKFFLHTNKTTYFSGEKVWFKAYVVYDVTNTPYYKTYNLYVNLYNSEKKLVSNQLFYVENGLIYGEIEIPSESISGRYYLELDTQWNKNFDSNYSFSIDVININKRKEIKNVEIQNSEAGFNMQFYPESNLLLENFENKIYFTSNYNNKPIKIKGKVIDSYTGRETSYIRSNENGMGFFKLPYIKGRTYFAYVTVNGKTHRFKISNPKRTGLVIQKKELQNDPKNISFSVKTNSATLNQNDGNFFFAVINRNGFLKTVIPIQLEKKYHNYTVNVLKENLFNGLNTITLFNQNNIPISSRNFYCFKNKQIELDVLKVNETNDEIKLDLTMLNKFTVANSSISVLPEKTKLYNNESNILTSFLLEPYINLDSKVLNSFFDKKMSSNDIDLILQTQKDTLINYNLIKNTRPHKPEIGLTIKGIVNSNLTNLNSSRVLLSSKENNILKFSKVKNGNSFVFDSLYLNYSSKYRLALIDYTGKKVKAEFKVEKQYTSYTPDSLLSITKASQFSLVQNQSSEEISIINAPKVAEKLKEVLIIGTNKTQKNDVNTSYPNNTQELGSGFTKALERNENECLDCTLLKLIDNYGNVTAKVAGNGNIGIRFNRGINTFLGSMDALVIVDKIRISSEEYEILRHIRAQDVKSIRVNASGAGYGIAGSNGVIIVETNNLSGSKSTLTSIDEQSVSSSYDFKISETDFGFSQPSKNYTQSSLTFNNNISKTYFNTIDWIPNFTIKPNTSNYLKINKSSEESIKLIINGMNNEGDLIFKIINIPTNKQL